MHSTQEKINMILGIHFDIGANWHMINNTIKRNEAKFKAIGIVLKEDKPANGINLGIDVIDLDNQLNAFIKRVKTIEIE